MARFRATIEGQGSGQASRMGTPQSGIHARINGWNVGVAVEGRAVGESDVFTIYATSGSHRAHREREIGTVRIVDGAPVFEAAARD